MKNILLYCLLFSFYTIVSMEEERIVKRTKQNKASELTDEYKRCCVDCGDISLLTTLDMKRAIARQSNCHKQCATIYKAQMKLLAKEKEQVKD